MTSIFLILWWCHRRPCFFTFFFFYWLTRCTLLLSLIAYGWRSQNSTQKLKKWFTGLRKTAAHQSLCLSPDQTGSLRMMVRTLCTTTMPYIYVQYINKNFFFFLNRSGLVISYQRQPGPAMLPLDSGWQNIQRIGSSIRRCQVAEGYAWLFHPTSVVCGDLKKKKKENLPWDATIFLKCLSDSYFIPTFFIIMVYGCCMDHARTIKMSL